MNILKKFCLLVIVAVGVSEGRPSFWDSVPVVSQAKMLILFTIGDNREAENVWKNFKNMTHLWDNVKHIDDSVPIYGHIKGIVVGLKGNEKRALEIFESVHKSTAIIGGGMLGGPAGGVIGAILADSTMSLAEHKPVGVVDYALHYSNASSSETVDVILDLTLAGVGNIGAKRVDLNKYTKNFKYSIPISFRKSSARENYNYNRKAPLASPDCFKDANIFETKGGSGGKRGSTISEQVIETGAAAGHMVHPHGSGYSSVQAINLKKGSEKETDQSD